MAPYSDSINKIKFGHIKNTLTSILQNKNAKEIIAASKQNTV